MCIIAGSILSTVVLTFGRRDVLSVLVTTLFAAYQSHWRHQNLARLFYRLTITLGLALFFLAGFTTARAVTAKGTNLGEYLTKFMEADVSGGLLAMATGQYAAANSMWVIENHPEPLDYFPYHSVLYAFINPIPRVLTGIVAAALALTSARAQTTSRYQSSIANNMPTLKDTARDATLISPSLAPVVSSSPLQSNVQMISKDDGFDLKITLTNTTDATIDGPAEPHPLGVLSVPGIRMGQSLSYADFRDDCQFTDVTMTSAQWGSFGFRHPEDIYSPVFVIRNSISFR